MQFRVYDNVNHKWADGDFCLSSFGDLFAVKRTLFGNEKIEIVDDEDYTVHMCTESRDKYGNFIFEGDICKYTGDDNTSGVVAYYEDNCAYYIFDDENSTYYRMIPDNREEMVIVGNVFDGIIYDVNENQEITDEGETA